MIFRALIWVLARIPLPLLWAFSWTIAWLWWTVVPIRKKLGIQNFRSVFPDLPPGPPLRRMFAGMVMGYLELLHELRRRVVRLDIERPEFVKGIVAQGKGVIAICGHFGSWDLVCPQVVRDHGLPGTAVVKIPAMPAVAKLMNDVRVTFGGRLISGRGTMPEIYEHIREGRLIAMFLDQRYKYGVVVPFFGRPAWTSAAVPVAAAKTGAPVIFFEYWREGMAHHAGRFVGPIPITGDAEKDTALIMSYYEAAIRARPHNWLWLHDRWKPLGEREKEAVAAKAAAEEA